MGQREAKGIAPKPHLGGCSPRPCRRGARPQASRKPTNPKSNGNKKQAPCFPLQAEAAAPPAREPQQTGTKRSGPRGQQAPAPSARTLSSVSEPRGLGGHRDFGRGGRGRGSLSMIDGPRGAGSRHGEHPCGDSEQRPAGLRGTRTEKHSTTALWVLLPLPSGPCARPPRKPSLHPGRPQRPTSSVELRRPILLRAASERNGSSAGVGLRGGQGVQRRLGARDQVWLRRGRAALGKGGPVTG